MKKIYSIGLIVSFLACYVKWGKMDQFAFEMMFWIVIDAFQGNVLNLLHPLVIAPFIAITLLAVTLFQEHANRKLILGGNLLLFPYVMILLLAGLLGCAIEMVVSTLPFLLVTVVFFFKYRNLGPKKPENL